MQPVAPAVENAYGLNASVVNVISLIYMGVYLVINFPSNYALDTWGIRIGVSRIIFLLFLGYNRYLPDSFWYVDQVLN